MIASVAQAARKEVDSASGHSRLQPAAVNIRRSDAETSRAAFPPTPCTVQWDFRDPSFEPSSLLTAKCT